MKAPKVSIEIPQYWVSHASDYHYFGVQQSNLRKIGIDCGFTEAGMEGFLYVAVFWVGEMPSEYVNEMKRKYD